GRLVVKTAGGEVCGEVRLRYASRHEDFAVLDVQIQAPVTPVVLADSESVRTGEAVYVIGNPAGLENTITDGLLSGRRPFIDRTLFQISAPVSPGSSGSPVFNGSGEVIGIAVASLNRGQNINFAIPINQVKPCLDGATGTSGSVESGEDRAAAAILENVAPLDSQSPGGESARESSVRTLVLEVSRNKTAMVFWLYANLRAYEAMIARDAPDRKELEILGLAISDAKAAVSEIESLFTMTVLAENSANRGRTDRWFFTWISARASLIRDMGARLRLMGHKEEGRHPVIARQLITLSGYFEKLFDEFKRLGALFGD
ncbi:MAG: trypsin-like peptidase domain-containing protein, partial [Candidatus Omnitrophica bacterium]|nr:trypsin-like peptidase domain-containing protein [Candidatus Omnitrophota bacterium]